MNIFQDGTTRGRPWLERIRLELTQRNEKLQYGNNDDLQLKKIENIDFQGFTFSKNVSEEWIIDKKQPKDDFRRAWVDLAK